MNDQDKPSWDEMQRDAAPDPLEQLEDAVLALLDDVRERYSMSPTEPFNCRHMRQLDAMTRHRRGT